LLVSSNASPKGLKISILGLTPFMARILKQFDPGDQPRKHLGSLVASYASARIFDDPCFTAREKLAGCGVATQLAQN